MMKELLLVSMGSFLGGGLRFLVSRAIQSLSILNFPFGTLTVNLLGCLLIGFLSALPCHGNMLSPSARLFLTTGFCGGFTTFSTFMNEGALLMKDGHGLLMLIYLFGSLALGLVGVIAGHLLAKAICRL